MDEKQLKLAADKAIRTIPDFPKEGILFKDITPIFLNQTLCTAITDWFVAQSKGKVDVVCGVESRGFLFGQLIANKLGVPFVMIRKAGKLPGETDRVSYDLEYGSATIEIHKGFIQKGQRVLIHDDLLATGGTAAAAAELVKKQDAIPAQFSFLVHLSFIEGEKVLKQYHADIVSLLKY